MAKKDDGCSMLVNLIADSNNPFASVVQDGIIGDVHGFTDTGSYALNGLISGSIYKGLPNGRVTALCGEEACGKTFFVLTTAKNFLDENKNGIVICFESEGALSKDMLVERGIDVKRFGVFPIGTVEEFKKQCIGILSKYNAVPESKRVPILIILDSLGMLSTNKEMKDSVDGKDTKDMTRAQVVRAVFRVVTLYLSKLKIPLILTNHVYAAVGSFFPSNEIAGGGGLKYAASGIVVIGKKQMKEGEEKVGIILPCKIYKSRFTIEGKKVEVGLRFDSGLQRYGGLLNLAIDAGIVQDDGKKKKFGDIAMSEKEINKAPETFFTKELLDKLDEYFAKEFCFGNGKELDNETPEEEKE